MQMAVKTTFTVNHALARNIAQAGIPVFPCHEADNGTKKAKAPRTLRGFKDATTDLGQIDRWWATFPDAVVGVPTGDPSGLSVIDGDIDRATGEAIGEQQIPACQLHHPDAVAVRTQSGGVQLIYKHVEGARTASKQVASHVDTRGEGGYIIAPGSVMANGATYTYKGRTLANALDTGDLPEFPLAEYSAALERQKAPTVPTFALVQKSQTHATDEETLEVARTLLSVAPNDLCREDWVKLAVSLRVGFGEALATEFLDFSSRYVGGDCSERDALHVWASSAQPKDITSIAPALALLKKSLGDDQTRSVWRDVLKKRDEVPDAPYAPEPAPSRRSSQFYSAATLKGAQVQPREWLVHGLIPQRTVTLFSGDGGTGKSLLALQLAVSTATGLTWIGKGVEDGRVIYMSAEDDDDELHRRLDDILRSENRNYDDVKGLTLRSLAGEDALLAVESQVALMQSELFKELDARAADEAPTLIVIDTLADVYPANENDRAKVRQFIGILRGLALKRQCAVLLLGHPSLTGLSSGTGSSGSTAWNNSVRSRLYLSRITDAGFEADPDRRVLTTMKANYGRVGEETHMKWHGGVFVPEASEQGLEKLASGAKAQRVFMKLLATFNAQGRQVNHVSGASFAPKIFSEHPDAEGMTKRALKAAMEGLLAAGKLKIEKEGPASRQRSFLVEGDI